MKTIEIRLAESADKEEILNLLNQVFEDVQKADFKRGDSFWNWKYEDNVFGKAILTVATVDGKIVGFNNLWPWQFKYRGKVLKALQPCDSVVHKDFQKYGIFSRMRIDGIERALHLGTDIIFNFPNQNSLPVYLNLGWNYVGRPIWNVCIINPVNIFISKFVKSEKSSPIQINNEFKLDIQKLEKLGRNKKYDKFIAINYVENFFEWRYLNHPTLEYGMVYLDKGHKSLAAIFNIKKSGRLTEMVIVDFVGNLNSLNELLPLIKSSARLLKADFFAFLHFGNFTKYELMKRGVLQMSKKNFTVMPLNNSLEDYSSKFINWSMMATMHDSI